jgi:hypothetical protein
MRRGGAIRGTMTATPNGIARDASPGIPEFAQS